MKYRFSKELDSIILDYCYSNKTSVKKLFKEWGMSTNTYYAIKRRGVLSEKTVRHLRKQFPTFDFNKLEIGNEI